jgi:hypothetical protein
MAEIQVFDTKISVDKLPKRGTKLSRAKISEGVKVGVIFPINFSLKTNTGNINLTTYIKSFVRGQKADIVTFKADGYPAIQCNFNLIANNSTKAIAKLFAEVLNEVKAAETERVAKLDKSNTEKDLYIKKLEDQINEQKVGRFADQMEYTSLLDTEIKKREAAERQIVSYKQQAIEDLNSYKNRVAEAHKMYANLRDKGASHKAAMAKLRKRDLAKFLEC